MPSFKVRRKSLALGGLEVTNGLTVNTGGATVTAGGVTVTAGGLTVTAGGATVTAGGLAVGGGTSITQFLAGTINIVCPSAASATVVVGTATATGLSTSHKLIAQISSPSNQGTFVVTAASAATNTLSASFLNTTDGDVSTSATMAVHYLAWT